MADGEGNTTIGDLTWRNTNNNGNGPCPTIDTPSYTFSLPNLRDQQPKEYRLFLEKELIETSSLKTLQQSGHLNWWTQLQMVEPSGSAPHSNAPTNAAASQLEALWPLSTSGDGNCLLHAASLGMWGFHDRLLILRKALHQFLGQGHRKHALWRRWRYQQSVHNKQIDLVLDEGEWRQEWNDLVQLASPSPRSKLRIKQKNSVKKEADQNANPDPVANPEEVEYEPGDDSTTYESLEEIHVFALAHVLKRPVVVVADTVLRGAAGDALAPIPFGGIYLPLECAPGDCHRSPLVLCYDSAHFSALVSMQQSQTDHRQHFAAIPITNGHNELLTVHFACDPGPDFTWWNDAADTRLVQRAKDTLGDGLALICQYMDVTALPIRRKASTLRAKPTDARPSDVSTAYSNTLPASPAHRVGQIINKSPLVRRCSRAMESSTLGRRPVNSKSSDAVAKQMPRARSFDRPTQYGTKELSRAKLHGMFKGLKQKLRGEASGSREHTSVVNAECHLSMCHVRSPSLICVASLHTQTHHQYMHDMVNAYLQSARRRFDQLHADKTSHNTLTGVKTGTGLSLASNSTKTSSTPTTTITTTTLSIASVPPLSSVSTRVSANDPMNGGSTNNSGNDSAQNTRRQRCMSRSLSTTSLSFTCMNGDCSRPAAPATNFLCDPCFFTQKEIMASFSKSQLCRTLKTSEEKVEVKIEGSKKDGAALRLMNGKAASDSWPDAKNTDGSDDEHETAVLSTQMHRTANGHTTRLGLTAVTNQHGVTHYFVPQKRTTVALNTDIMNEYCRSPHCANYSNGHGTLCAGCKKKVDS